MSLRVLVLVWSVCWVFVLKGNASGQCTRESNPQPSPVRLRVVGAGARCRGELQFYTGRGQWEQGQWVGVFSLMVPQWLGHRLCAALDCGPVLSLEEQTVAQREAVVLSGFCDHEPLSHCFGSDVIQLRRSLELNCSDSVRLVGGRSLCSGSLQIWDQSLAQSWTPVCEGALDRRGAEVLCRELGCGAPLLQGALSPLGQTFLCEGHESALMDCPRNQTRTEPGTCSPLHLTCSEPVQLVGGASRCEGTLEVKHRGQWRRLVTHSRWDLQSAAGVCRDLDCGSARSTHKRADLNETEVWAMIPDCERKAALRDCVISGFSAPSGMNVVCSDSVRLVGGRSLCSGSLQTRDQSLAQSWTPVCEGALDRRGAEVLCRELGCGAPLLQGALSPLGQTFLCEGHESALMDCPRNRTRTEPGICSGPSLNVTCSELVRLVGGSSRCEGTLEVKHRGQWRRAVTPYYPWDLEAVGVACRDLGCGAVVSTEQRQTFNWSDVWGVRADCVKAAALRDCVFDSRPFRFYGVFVVCSGNVQETGTSDGFTGARGPSPADVGLPQKKKKWYIY